MLVFYFVWPTVQCMHVSLAYSIFVYTCLVYYSFTYNLCIQCAPARYTFMNSLSLIACDHWDTVHVQCINYSSHYWAVRHLIMMCCHSVFVCVSLIEYIRIIHSSLGHLDCKLSLLILREGRATRAILFTSSCPVAVCLYLLFVALSFTVYTSMLCPGLVHWRPNAPPTTCCHGQL